MARRKASGTQAPRKPAQTAEAGGDANTTAPDPVAELDVLFPDIDVAVRDPDSGEAVTLTVREFRFLEGLEAQAEARPLIDTLSVLIDGGGDGDEAQPDALPDAPAIDAAIGQHASLWLSLIGRACDREVSWLARLTDRDARQVTLAMWSVNSGFFLSRAMTAVMARRQTANLLHSAAFSLASSAPDTAPATPTSPVA